MIRKIRYAIFLSLLGFVACTDNAKTNSIYFTEAKNSKHITINSINLDTLYLDIISSFDGILKIKEDKIYYVDKRFCKVYEFDKDLKLIGTNLGQGGGPKELNAGVIVKFDVLDNNKFFFLGSANDCHIHNKDYKREKIKILNKVAPQTNKKNLKKIDNITGDMIWAYSFNTVKSVTRNNNDKLYYTIDAAHPKFNPITTPEEYLNNGRIIAEIDLSEMKIINGLGRVSPVYKKYKYLSHLNFTSFDINNKGDFFVCYEIDPVIYQYDNKFKLKAAFGYKGRDMNTDYKELSTINDVRREFANEREKAGYYTWIEYIDERELLFRSYKKGNKEKTDGLQIYKNNELIADLDVPIGFRVSGYIEPYFYSNTIDDEDNEIIKIYRFKLE